MFAGGAALAAVEGICAGEGLEGDAVVGLLVGLVSKSLVLTEDHGGESRYRVLVPMRHYARERLRESGERERLEARHSRYYAYLAEEREPELGSIDEGAALAWLDLEHDNMRAALRAALRSDPELALRLASALWRYWLARGYLVEGMSWLEAALAGAPEDGALRAQALVGLAVLAVRQGDRPRAGAALERSVGLSRERGDERAAAAAERQLVVLEFLSEGSLDEVERKLERRRAQVEALADLPLLVSVLHSLAFSADQRGDLTRVEALLGECLTLLREAEPDRLLVLPLTLGLVITTEGSGGTPRLLVEDSLMSIRRLRPAQATGRVLANLGTLHRNAGRADAARSRLEESLALFRELGDAMGIAQALAHLGCLLRVEGEHDLARDLLEEALALHEQAGTIRGVGFGLSNLGLLAARAGDFPRARDLLRQARQRFEASDDRPGVGATLIGLGYVAADGGATEEAVSLLERGAAIWRQLHYGRLVAWVEVSLAVLATEVGDRERVGAHLGSALASFRRIGNRAGVAWCERLERSERITGPPETRCRRRSSGG